MNHTKTYKLSQWEKTDRILMSDFNADNAKIETALSALAGTQTSEVQRLDTSIAAAKSELSAAVAAAEAKIAPAIENRLAIVPLLETTATGTGERSLLIPINGLLLGECLIAMLEVTPGCSTNSYVGTTSGGSHSNGSGMSGGGFGYLKLSGKPQTFLLFPMRNPDSTPLVFSMSNSFSAGYGGDTCRETTSIRVSAVNSSDKITGTYKVRAWGIK